MLKDKIDKLFEVKTRNFNNKYQIIFDEKSNDKVYGLLGKFYSMNFDELKFILEKAGPKNEKIVGLSLDMNSRLLNVYVEDRF